MYQRHEMKTHNGPNMDFEEEFKHEILKNTISIVEQLKEIGRAHV